MLPSNKMKRDYPSSDKTANSAFLNVERALGAIVSITILCVAVTVGWRGESAAQDQPRSIGGGFYQMRLPTESAPLKQNQELEISVVGKLPVSGMLEIDVRDVNEISVDVSATFRADDAEQASETMSTSGARLLSTDNGMQLKFRVDPSVWPLFEGDKLSLEMTVTVPLATAIKLEAPYLQVRTEGALAELTINDTYEPVEVRGARGMLQIDSRNNNVSVTDLIGSFDIRTSNAKVTLTEIQVVGDTARSGRSPVSRVRNEDGRIEIRRYSGPLHARTARADIRIRDIMLTGSRNWIENSGGLINVTFSGLGESARLDVRNSYEDVQLTFSRDISAMFTLRTKDGKAIEFENLPHRILDVRENRIEAESGDGEALISVRAKYGGSILIVGKP